MPESIGKFLKIFILLLIMPLIVLDIQAAGYKLQEDDHLAISVWGHPDLAIEVSVDPDGKISLPLLGNLSVEGLTLQELNDLLVEKYKEYIKEPRVSLSIKEYRKSQVMVLGEVRNPGTYELKGDKRILDLISLAGGATELAALDQVRLTRGTEIIEINLKGLLTGSILEGNYLLEDGDILYLPEEIAELSIFGEVVRPGSYPWREGKRLSELLAEAGNQTDKGDISEIRISSEDGSIQFVNLYDYLEEGALNADPVLKPGDSIYIRKKVFEVTILGEVNRPGSYTWHEEMRLDKLLAQAGNQTERGDIEKIKLIHQDGSSEEINLTGYFAGEDNGTNPLLQPGDTVKIEEVKGIDWQKVFAYVSGANLIKDFLGLDW